ncbi:MAG TPA: 16S rRNA (cytidine(1402)-2'-O)-methyltransferase [Terriglobales bacterium]|nr:16S rRNA (cytidine(1402)-2'-O)-methyltransferase [Terriglobales bacterium]
MLSSETMAAPQKKGVLYVVGTPIGNLEDLTVRALRILKEVDLIACEDTRQTRKLLDHYGIEKPLVSYHEHNEPARAQELVDKLKAGMSVAQVSDAGMPGIADPGYRVIKLAIENGAIVAPVPGPSALIAALVGSGLATDAFEFHGFLPAKSGQRRTALEKLRGAEHTVVVYEAPHRIRETVEDLVEVLGPARPLVIARELTKMHEEFLRGSAAELLEKVRDRELKGEITLLIGKSETGDRPATGSPAVRQRLEQIMAQEKLDEKAALKKVAKELGLSRSQAYRELQRSK